MNRVQFFKTQTAVRAVVLEQDDHIWMVRDIFECDTLETLKKVFAKEGKKFDFGGLTPLRALGNATREARKAEAEVSKANRQRIAVEVAELILGLKEYDDLDPNNPTPRGQALEEAAAFVRKVFD